MKYFKITIEENDKLNVAVASAETEERIQTACKNKLAEGSYRIEEISINEFKKLKGKTPETKEEIKNKFEEIHEETKAIDITKFKGKKIIPFEGCPYRIEEKYQEATKENILLIASSLNPFGFKDAKSAVKYLLGIGFKIK
jgi:hypothetical protein